MEDTHPCICPIANVCSRSRGPFREVQRPHQSILYVEGQPAEYVYLIRKGTVSLHHAKTENQTLGRARALRHEGALLGVEALVSPTYQSSAKAETPLLLCMATSNRVADWVAERHAASRTVLESILRTGAEEFEAQSSPDGTAAQRVAHWILERYETELDNDLPRTVMADMLGMRPETLSRALRGLAKKGYIQVSRRQLMVVDADGLRDTLPR